MRAQRHTALSALADQRDVAIGLRRELADMTRQRDAAFEQAHAVRTLAQQALLARIPYPEPPPAILQTRAAVERAQASLATAAFADMPVHPEGALWAACTCVPGRSDALRRG
jgi:hypothetical protein